MPITSPYKGCFSREKCPIILLYVDDQHSSEYKFIFLKAWLLFSWTMNSVRSRIKRKKYDFYCI